MRGDRRRGRSSSRVFLSPFGHRHSLLGHPVPPGASAPLTVGLPRHHRQHGPERGFHVPHARDPAGIGRPLYPGGDGVDATEEWCPVAAAASQRPAPVTPALHSVPGCVYHEASTRIHSIRPSSLPLTCDPPDGAGGPWAFPRSFTPPDTRCPSARQGRDRSSTLTRATSPASADLPDVTTHNVRPRVATTRTRTTGGASGHWLQSCRSGCAPLAADW